MKLHIFNPEHDLALAANIARFTAPHAGRQLRSDLAFLPALWAEKDDFVLVDDIDSARLKARRLTGDEEHVEFITPAQLQGVFADTFLVDSVHPWGWDLALCDELRRMGCPDIMLPDAQTLQRQRELSSRQWAAENLQQDVVYVTSADDFLAVLADRRKVVVKAPWSSSGRGVRYVTPEDVRQGMEQSPAGLWIRNVLKRQGGVTVEPYYNKVRDFGMEFEMRDGHLEYCGLSLFQTLKNAYTGNVLAVEEEKEAMMAKYVDASILKGIRLKLCSKLEPALRGVYSGPLGVDMMVCAPDGGGPLFVNPCVELNLRRTMGHVALSLSHHLDRQRLMRVAYDGSHYRLNVLPGEPSPEAPIH